MPASQNKFLKIKEGVILTPVIEPVIIALDKYFEAANCPARVTSGLRLAEDQLRIIRGYIASKGLSNQYLDAINKGLKDKIEFNGQQVYAWQPGWSALLNKGVIINPPIAAICLMDYINKYGVNRKGQIIQTSVHFKGIAFDIGGGPDGISGTITNELSVLQKAKADNLKGLKGFLPERENNALHCDCIAA